MRLIFFVYLFSVCILHAQDSLAPIDITSHCELVTSEDSNPIIKCTQIPIDISLPAGSYELLHACWDSLRFNALCRSTVSNNFLIVAANKHNEEWKEKDVHSHLYLLPNILIREKKKISEYHFPDINTLIIVYEFSDKSKKSYLIRMVDKGFNFYLPKVDLFSDESIGERRDIESLRSRDSMTSLRPRY